MNFLDFNDNHSIKHQLNSFSQNNRMPHAIIIEGGSPQQREALAQLLSMWAVCVNSGSRPCGECAQCRKAKNNSHGDIKIAEGSGKTNIISIEEIRKITRDAVIIPNEAAVKVYMLADADKRMQREAQNAFLKTLEEPPQNILFLLTCEKAGAMLPTILSRVTVLSLDENKQPETEVLELAADIAVSIIQTKEISLLLSTGKLNSKSLAMQVLPCVGDILRDALAVSCGGQAVTNRQAADKLAVKLTKKRIMQLIDITNDALIKIDQNVNMNLLVTWLCGEYRRIAWQR